MHGCVMTQPFLAATVQPPCLSLSPCRGMGTGNRTSVLSQLRNETVRPRDQEGVQGWLHCDSVVVFDCAMVTLTAATHVTAAAF